MIELNNKTPRISQLRRAGVVVEWIHESAFVTASEEQWAQGLRKLLAEHADAIASELGRTHVASQDCAKVVESGPLAPSQQRLLGVESALPGAGAWQEPETYYLDGPLNAAALERALSALIARQSALRTMIRRRESDGLTIQLVCDAAPFVVTTYDRTDAEDQEQALRQVILDESGRVFSMRQGNLFRVSLVRFNQDKHALLLGIHHLISDGWSVAILLEELGFLYAAELTGERAALPPIERSFASLSAELCARQDSDEVRASLLYWLDRLGPPWHPIGLPIAEPSTEFVSLRAQVLPVLIDSDLVAVLRARAAALGVTLPALLLGVFAKHMHEVTGSDDLRIGTMAANRGQPDSEHLIGFFSNVIVLRFAKARMREMEAWIRRANELLRDGLRHQEAPFQDVLQALSEQNKDFESSSILPLMFVVNNFPGGTLRLPRLSCEQRAVKEGVRIHMTTIELRVQLQPQACGELRGYVSYKYPKYDRDTMEAIWDSFLTLLSGQAATIDPAAPESIEGQLTGTSHE